MKTTKGLFTDTSLYDTPPGYLIFAKNILLTEKLGVIQNEKGFVKLLTSLDKSCIGALPVQDDLILWSITPAGLSEIGKMDPAGVYTKIVNDTDFGSSMNFSVDAPIKAEYYIDYKGEIIIAWIDDINTPKILNITTPSLQIQDLELFPAADIPIPTVTVLQSGGSLLTGVYRILYKYEDQDGSFSTYSATSKPVSIIQDTSSVGVDANGISLVWGSAPGITTSKGIKVTLANLDQNWKYVDVAVLKTVNSITTVEQFSKQPIIGSTMTLSYTGAEQATVLTLEEVLTPAAVYTNAKAITQLNNKLYLADLTTEETISLQKFCMNVKVKWNSQLITAQEGGNISAEKEASGTKYSSFAHGEVYALYLQFRETKTGLWTQGFHIPGPQKYDAAYWASQGWETTIAPSPVGTYVSGNQSPAFAKYQLEDTGITNTGVLGGAQTGTLGVWRNQNESYPDLPEYDGSTDYDGNPIAGGLDYRNTNVVHGKFPSLNWMANLYGAGVYGKSSLDILGALPYNVNIGSFSSKFSSYRLCYAKRTIDNATNLGTSGVYFFGKSSQTDVLRPLVTNGSTYSGTVFGTTYSNAVILGNDNASYSSGAEFIRWHAFNTQIDLPAVSPSYLRNEYAITYNPNGASTAPSTDARVLTDVTTITDTRKYLAHGPATSTVYPIGYPTSNTRFKHVEFVQYLPSNAIVTSHGKTIDNRYGENCMLLWHDTGGITNYDDKTMYLTGPATLTSGSLNPDIVLQNSYHKTFISTLCNLKTDVYVNFYGQELIATDTEIFISSPLGLSDYVRGGDTWQGFHSIHLQGPYGDAVLLNDVTTGPALGQGCKAVHLIMAEAPKNLNYRYQDIANIQSAFYSKSALPKVTNANYASIYLGLMNISQSPVYLYNADYNTLNSTGITLTAYNPFTIVNTRFPTTIASSLTVGNESAIVSWKNFLASDRYTMPRNKGDIVNLQGVGNQKLYIHMTNGLFITKDRVSLKTTAADVTLGSGNIFDVTPYEVISTTEGYAGTRNKFGCVLTKAGYVSADLSQGKIFIHNGEQLEEISKNGTRQFWRDMLETLPDNPFAGNGVTIAYDEQYNRILFTVKNQTAGNFITASYSPQLEAWVSFHDYDPAYMVSTRGNKLYSIRNFAGNLEVYKHNAGEYGQYYQTDGSKYPAMADVVHNKDPYQTKVFKSINFVTQVTDSSNLVINDETVDYITVRSVDKTTGRVEIERYVNTAEVYDTNSRFTETFWSFNKMRNEAVKPAVGPLTLDFYSNYTVNPAILSTNTDWYDKGRFIDNYIVVRFEYSNLNNNKFLLLDQDVEFRNSIRS